MSDVTISTSKNWSGWLFQNLLFSFSHFVRLHSDNGARLHTFGSSKDNIASISIEFLMYATNIHRQIVIFPCLPMANSSQIHLISLLMVCFSQIYHIFLYIVQCSYMLICIHAFQFETSVYVDTVIRIF